MVTTLQMATYLDCLNPRWNAERVSYFRFTNDWMSLPVKTNAVRNFQEKPYKVLNNNINNKTIFKEEAPVK